MKSTTIGTYEAKIYVGTRQGYDGPTFEKLDVQEVIKDYQASLHEYRTCSVRITNTTFMFRDYVEDGYEIVVINYPRFPKEVEIIKQFAMGLGESLLVKLKQNRISIVLPEFTTMIESNNE